MHLLRYLFIAIIASCFIYTARAQEENRPQKYALEKLTPLEEAQLMSLPELKPPPGYPLRDLPTVVDNSTQPCMRPVFNQDGLCCGQAAGIAYAFTYEMDRARSLDASQAENQYPTHFSWNFMNGGNGWYGVSYRHSFQILKECGMPDVIDYGGTLSYGGPQRWMSGYNEYSNGMHNRTNNAYQIFGGSEEGLQIIKSWLYDHLENSSVGGVCNFYAQYMSASSTLPPGTPEAGKYVLTYFGGSANHAMTIVGYNDSIRWDYNGDGQYTNNLDITGDGVVDMRDWEIGGFKMVQSYGGVPNWGDQGYAYMMYKTIADPIGSGGIWNHCVHILDVKESYDPKLTARIILKHDWRGKVGVSIGLANNATANTPEISFTYPIFDYQGTNQYMQGGTTEEDKTIEFGLDLSKFLTYVELDQEVKFFLNVVEKDSSNQGTGQVIHFSIYDQTDGGGEIISPQSNVPISENDTTTLTVIHTFNFDRVQIVDESLPPAPPGQYYSYQLTANYGTPPYSWELDKSYPESHGTSAFPVNTGTHLYPSNNSNGKVTQAIDFDFPFYDSVYNDITVYVDGYLMFDEQLFPYPYFIDDKVLFEITRNISPFMNQHQNIVTGGGQGIYYEGDALSATFRWRTCIENNTSQVLNYAVTLYPDGRIEYCYGENTPTGEYLWISGISDGDNINHQKTAISNKPSIPENYLTELVPYSYPPEMTLSSDGIYFGTPATPYNAENITFKVTDNNFISSKKTLQLSGNGIVVTDSINSGGNQVIEFGETVLQSVELLNIEDHPIPDATMIIRINDPFITITDSSQALGTLPVGVARLYTDAFSFDISPDIPDNHLIEIATEIISDTNTWESRLFHHAYAPVPSISDVLVDDENNRLDPGDTSNIVVTLINSGGAPATSVYAILSSADPMVTIISGLQNIAYFGPNSTEEVTYNVSVSDETLNGQVISFILEMTGDQDFEASDTFDLAVGLFQENFESGNFTLFNWGCAGERDWSVNSESTFEGLFSAKSGPITHSEESVLMLDIDAQQDGEAGFYSMVSCEDDTTAADNYDYLAFFVDGTEMGRWDGITDWEYHEYPLETGYHRLEWRYHKDQSVNRGSDAAWIDLVSFPAPVPAGPDLSVDPGTIEITLKPDELDFDTLYLFNSGPGDILFEIDIAGAEPGRQVTGARNLHSTGRSMSGSTLVSSGKKVNTGKAYTWELRTYCASPDNEWTKDIYIDFPAGVELTVGNEFTGGSGGPLLFEGPLGNGITSHWHGEDENGWGVIHGGETATSEITFYVHDYLSLNPAMHYEIHGDIYGATPHVVSGEIEMQNLGPEIEWLETGIAEGTLPGGTTMPVVLTINTGGLEDGDYQAWILINDNHFNEFVIPVHLTVDTYLGIASRVSPDRDVKVFPNPFKDVTNISFRSDKEAQGNLLITDSKGKTVFSTSLNVMKGENQIRWNAFDNGGNKLSKGVYIGKLSFGDSVHYLKMVIGR